MNEYTLPVAQTLGWDEADKGSFMGGLLAGLFLGCAAILAALISSRTMGRETRQGIYVGFCINLLLSVLYGIAKRL
jgi:hypothetical protein